jgi:putative transposase
VGKPHRLAGFNYRGRFRIFITCCTKQRHLAFSETAACEFLLTQLQAQAKAGDFEILAYCWMPDHVHLLLGGVAADSDLQALMRGWKQSTGYWYRGQTGRALWQGNYWDYLLRDPDDSLRIVHYIISDPVRSGIVERLEQYAWWGSDRWTREELVAITALAERPAWWIE